MQQNIPNIPIYQNKSYAQLSQNQQQQPSFTAGNQVSSGSSLIQNNPVLKHAEKAKENNGGGYMANLAITGVGMFGLNEFLNRSLQGNYDKTMLKKMEGWIDKFAAKPKVASAIQKASVKKSALKTWLEKSELYNTLIKKQSVGGNMVQSQAAGVKGHISTRAIDAMKKYKTYMEKTTGNPYTVFDNAISKYGSEAHLHTNKIMATIAKAGKNGTADLSLKMTKRTWWSFGLFKNKVNLQEILNKNQLVRNYKNIATAGIKPTIGQRAVGTFMRTAECVTNGMFGGIGQVLFQAFFIASALQEARKAEKGEKVGSFAGSLLEQMSYIGAIGLQMRVVNGLAGLKNLKMNPAQFQQHQNLMSKINAAAKAGDAAAYNAGITNLKAFKSSLPKYKGMEKVANIIGKIFSFGRASEMVAPLKGNLAGKMAWGAKFGLGYIMRGAFIFGVVMPVIAGIAKNIGYAIFGRPTKTIAREKAKEKAEKEAAKNEQQPQNQPPQAVQTPQQPNPVQNPAQPQQPQAQSKPGDLVEKMKHMNENKPIGAQTMTPDSPTPIASTDLKSPDSKIKRTYMPNPILGPEAAVNPASSRSAQIDRIMRQADLAEAQAHKLGV